MRAKLAGRARPGVRLFVPVTVLVSITMLAAACGGGSAAPTSTAFPGAAVPAGSWPYPNGDIANTRDAPDSAISAANVSGMREAWAFKLVGTAAAGVSGIGSLTAPPVVQDGVVYLQDEDANVYALALATGKLKWEYPVNIPEKSGPGPDGVAVADGTVYGDSSTSVFALNAATELPSSSDKVRVLRAVVHGGWLSDAAVSRDFNICLTTLGGGVDYHYVVSGGGD